MNGKTKGNKFERDISRFLTKWLTGKEKPYMFFRNDASGGLSTIHRENTHMTGDIKHLHEDSKFFTDIFSIECKDGYPKTSLHQHFKSERFNIKKFWEQALNDANKANKNPMLIFKKKNQKAIVGISYYIDRKLKKYLKEKNSIIFRWNDIDDCIFYDITDFFEIEPFELKKVLTRSKINDN